jgi:serine/threonine protein kinase
MSKVFTITEGLENMGALRTGGQGSVYKGRRIGPIITAVKILPTPIHTESIEDKNYRNFLNEVDKLKKVNKIPNPNVVKILNSGITESGSFPFIEMEFIEGPDLGELLAEPNDKLFKLKDVVKLADQLACALAHCHKVGVKHGDIKSNKHQIQHQFRAIMYCWILAYRSCLTSSAVPACAMRGLLSLWHPSKMRVRCYSKPIFIAMGLSCTNY